MQRDLLGGPRQQVSALVPAPAPDQAMDAELDQDLGQEVGGHRLGPGQMVDPGELARAVQPGQFSHDPAGVVDLKRDLHAQIT